MVSHAYLESVKGEMNRTKTTDSRGMATDRLVPTTVAGRESTTPDDNRTLKLSLVSREILIFSCFLTGSEKHSPPFTFLNIVPC